MKSERFLWGALALLAGCLPAGLSAQDDAPAQMSAEQAPDQQVSDEEALEAMGYAMAQQLRLNIGFSDEEMSSIFDGMRLAAKGAPPPAEDMTHVLQRARSIYQQKEQAASEAEAKKNRDAAEEYMSALIANDSGIQKTDSGLYYTIVTPGTTKPSETDLVKIMYEGRKIDDTVFDKSEQPIAMRVNQFVPGFAEGLQLVGVGGHIRMWIPGELAYGMQPPRNSSIGADEMLVFDVDLQQIIPPPPNIPPPSLPADLQAKKNAKGTPGKAPNMHPPGPPPNVTPPPPPSSKPSEPKE